MFFWVIFSVFFLFFVILLMIAWSYEYGYRKGWEEHKRLMRMTNYAAYDQMMSVYNREQLQKNRKY